MVGSHKVMGSSVFKISILPNGLRWGLLVLWLPQNDVKSIVGASLSKLHTSGNLVGWSVHEEPQRKTGLQHTTIVWYGGSCTNKHDKLMDTSIQVLSNTKIFDFIYWRSILGWYSQPCHKEWMVKITVDPRKGGMVNHATKNEWQRLQLTHVRVVRSTMPQRMNGKDYSWLT